MALVMALESNCSRGGACKKITSLGISYDIAIRGGWLLAKSAHCMAPMAGLSEELSVNSDVWFIMNYKRYAFD